MATWAEEFDQADFEQRVADVRAAADALSNDVRAQADASYPGTLEQLQVVLDYVLAGVGLVNPALVPPSSRSAVIQRLDECKNGLTSAVQSSEAGPISSVQNALDPLATLLSSWPISMKVTASSLSKAAATFGRSMEKQVASVKRDVQKGSSEAQAANQQVEELKGVINDAKRQTLDSLTQSKDEARAALDELKQSIETERGRIDSFATQFQKQFGDAQDKRGQQFNELIATLNRERDEFVTSVRESTEELGESLKAEADAKIQEIKDLGEKAGALVEVITAHGTSEGYGQEADEQRKVANIWRWIAIVVAVVAGAVAVATVLQVADAKDESAAHIVSRALATLALIGVAGYAAKESSRHRRREELAKRRQLELAALEPFLEGLDVESRRPVRAAIANRLFANPDPDPHDRQDVLTSGNVSVIAQLADAVKKFIK